MNKETLRMQMLSGIITESEYKAKLETLNEGIKDYPKVIKKEKYVLVRGLYPSNPNTSIKIFPSNGLTLSDFDKWKTELLDIAKKGSITKKPGTSFSFSVYADENGKPTEKRVGQEGTDEPEYAFHSTSPSSLKENFVGTGMVGNIFDREKTDYELAFEHFAKGTSLKSKLNEYDDFDTESSSVFFDQLANKLKTFLKNEINLSDLEIDGVKIPEEETLEDAVNGMMEVLGVVMKGKAYTVGEKEVSPEFLNRFK